MNLGVVIIVVMNIVESYHIGMDVHIVAATGCTGCRFFLLQLVLQLLSHLRQFSKLRRKWLPSFLHLLHEENEAGDVLPKRIASAHILQVYFECPDC